MGLFDWWKRGKAAATAAPAKGEARPPVEPPPPGIWIRARLQGPPDSPAVIAFTYRDPDVGLSARGGFEGQPRIATAPNVTMRIPGGCESWTPIPDGEARRMGLPSRPDWADRPQGPVSPPTAPPGPAQGEALAAQGPSSSDVPMPQQPSQPDPDKPWRTDPLVAAFFHKDHPDDLAVAFIEGGVREVMWVRVEGSQGVPGEYHGLLLNQPHRLEGVRRGDQVVFRAAGGEPYPTFARKLD